MQPFTLRWLIPFTLVVLLLAACGDTADDGADTTLARTTTTTAVNTATTSTRPATTEATTTTEPTTTTAEPTTTEAVEVLSLRLTFDGESCIYEGPTVLAAGPVELLFLNESERFATAHISMLTGDETLQDMLDYVGDPPSPFEPPWATRVNAWHPVNPGKTSTWEGDLEASIHTVACIDTHMTDGGGAYFATGLTVEP